MPNKAYNYNFKMFMEGIEIPFQSIQTMSTPNGTEANINLLSNKQVFELKPKTAVQVFYRDWVNVDGKKAWRLMFDGFLSSYVKNDQATQGRGLSIVCRDFRMDIRKAPAALVFQPDPQSISIQTEYFAQGLNITNIIKGTNKGTERDTRVFDTTGLQSLGFMMSLIAGTSYGDREKVIKKASTNNGDVKTKYPKTQQKKGKSSYSKNIGDSIPVDTNIKADCRFFLDSVVRGIWTEAVGGSSVSAFMNKRIRVDKRFFIPPNRTGYSFWSNQTAGLHAGNVLLGNAKFTSVEAAIMRLAGLFSVRVYSCTTPSLIDLDNDDALRWTMDQKVKGYLVDRFSDEFGAKYILNETMLLPPLEFTAPPNCNIIFPPMYDRVNWQYDIDGDVTRGYYKVVNTLSTSGSNGLKSQSYQFPNSLFNIYTEGKDPKKKEYDNSKKDQYKRIKPPLTLEERYKGIAVSYGSISDTLARNDASKEWPEFLLKAETADKVRRRENELKNEIRNLRRRTETNAIKSQISKLNKQAVKAEAERKKIERDVKKKSTKGGGYSNINASVALKRHAALKFLNARYIGRVAVVDMAFNPYPMSGFPGAIIVDDESFGDSSSKTIIGMVQQVKHSIIISSNGCVATTSLILNQARFEDEPTDVDEFGNPLYMKETDKLKAVIDKDTGVYANKYSIPEPKPLLKKDLNDSKYDLDQSIESTQYIYAKDIITLTESDRESGERNTNYLDEEYTPNRIGKFYKDAFGHKTDHFMIDETPSPDNPKETVKFIYDTMHEGLVKLRQNKKHLLNDYEECLKFVHRNICNADAFFQGIMGCSIIQDVLDEDGNVIGKEYVNNKSGYVPERIFDSYFGVTNSIYDGETINGLKQENGGLMTKVGQFSSINESMPITAFIQERRDAVEAYLKRVKQRAEGVQFSNAQRYNQPER